MENEMNMVKSAAQMSQKAIAHVVKMLEGKGGEKWEGDCPQYEGICGWCGVMAPMNRPAFVQKFGEDATAQFEAAARKVLADRASFWENSKAKGYAAQADALMEADPATYKEGDFVWGVMDGMKFDHENLRKVVKDIIEDEAEGQANVRLCRIIRIEDAEDIEANMETLMRDWKPQENEGGSNSDDVTEEECGRFGANWRNLSEEQKRTFYTLAVLIRDGKGKFVLIDPEGYDYPRYAILPKNWRTMFADTVETVTAEIKAEKEAAEAAKKKAEEDRNRKWDEAVAKARRRFSYIPCPKVEGRYLRTGEVSRNLRAILRHEFPGVKFTVRSDSYSTGDSVSVRWVDGPAYDIVNELVDAFQSSRNEPMTYYWDTVPTAVTEVCGDFSYTFAEREISPEIRKTVEDLIRQNLHGADEDAIYREASRALSNTSFPNGEYEIEGIEFNLEKGHYDIKVRGKSAPQTPPPPTDGGDLPDNGDPDKGEAYWKENREKKGIEIYFPAKPSDDIIADLKHFRWRWSRFSKCWYNRMDDGTYESARDIVMRYNGQAAA